MIKKNERKRDKFFGGDIPLCRLPKSSTTKLLKADVENKKRKVSQQIKLIILKERRRGKKRMKEWVYTLKSMQAGERW